jgi:hypothetical protein
MHAVALQSSTQSLLPGGAQPAITAGEFVLGAGTTTAAGLVIANGGGTGARAIGNTAGATAGASLAAQGSTGTMAVTSTGPIMQVCTMIVSYTV